MPPILELRTLSGTRLVSDGGAELLGPGKPLALLVYLACSPRQSATREHLIDLLWSDLPVDKARHTLRQALWYLRRIIPEGLAVPGDDITLVQPLRFDRDEFLAAAKREDLDQALAIYQQEFLSGFALPGGVEFEQWADVERQQLSAVFLRSVEQASRRHLDAGRFAPAIALARRARDAAPGRERGWRLLLEALVAAQDPVGFALEATALSARLQQEERQPEPATRQLLERLTRADLMPAAHDLSQVIAPALVGRSRQFAVIVEAWDECRQQRGRHLHLDGAAGLGKSRLLTDVYHRLRGRGARAVQLRATPADRTIPFSLAAEVARVLAELPGAAGISSGSAATLVALSPSLTSRFTAAPDTATGGEAVRRRSTALTELLVAVLDEQPVALLLDDLHWSDPASLQCLRPLLERVRTMPALVVTAARPTPGVPLPDGTEVLTIPPLTPEQVTELLASVAPLPDTPWASALPALLHRNAGGVPLLLLETLQLARDRGRLVLTGDGWECPDWDALRQQLEDEIGLRQRVADLPPEPGRVLLALAVAGQPLRAEELAGVLGWDLRAMEQALAHLELRGLAQQASEQWQPSHDEVAAFASDLADPGVRRALHRAFGDLRASQATSARDLVRAGHHLALAEHWPGLRATFLRFLQRRRREGDHRRVRFIASDFLEGVPDTQVEDLLSRLGRLNLVRYELARPAVWVALLACLAVGVTLTALSRGPTPDTELLIRDLKAPRASAIIRVPLSPDNWRPDQPIDLSTLARTAFPGRGGVGLSVAIRPGGGLWAVTESSPDSGDSAGTHVTIYDGEGHAIPFARGRGDNNVGSWLADGSGLVLSTGRWSGDFYDLMAQSLSGSIRRLTSDPLQDGGGFVSPDGTRIAFVRTGIPEGSAVCVQGLDSLPPAMCITGAGPAFSSVGWADNNTLLTLKAQPDGLNRLEALDLASRGSRLLLENVHDVLPSPDARWLVFDQLVPGRPALAWFVAPMSAPTRPRELLGYRGGAYQPLWQVNSPVPWLAAIALTKPRDPLPPHTGYKFKVQGLDQDGRTIAIKVPLRWTSVDTTIARIDTSGLLTPRREGHTRIIAEVPGWRADTADVFVQVTRAAEVFREDWSGGMSRWKPFGTPPPVIVDLGKDRHAFLNNGDGRYTSGAFTRRAWPATSGFGAEVEISTPLTETHWQRAQFSLAGGLDSSMSAEVMERGGADNATLLASSCEMEIPATEGIAAMSEMSLVYSSIVVRRPAPSRTDGHWVRWRIQVFPDGTCGMAVDGVPIFHTPLGIPLDRPVGILLTGSSAKTRILHGGITAWTGVKDDIDWGVLQNTTEGGTSRTH
ncbi:MAG: AAA family ATPase [Gemmatimonadales bacterium]